MTLTPCNPRPDYTQQIPATNSPMQSHFPIQGGTPHTQEVCCGQRSAQGSTPPMQLGSPDAHALPALTTPSLHSSGTTHPALGNSHPPHLPLDQSLTCHPTHDPDALITSDALTTTAVSSAYIKETMRAKSVYTPTAPWVKDTSHVSSGNYTSPFKDHLSHVSTHRSIDHTETPSLTSNSVSVTTPPLQKQRWISTDCHRLPQRACCASNANITERSAAFPLCKGSSGSALWTKTGAHCHWDMTVGSPYGHIIAVSPILFPIHTLCHVLHFPLCLSCCCHVICSPHFSVLLYH